MALPQAFRSQCTIGWEHFLRGRTSIQWEKAYSLTQERKDSTKTSSKTWTSNLIALLLFYTFSLWTLWNGVVHCHNMEEEERKKRERLHNNIINAYMAYNADKFIVSRHLSSLFDKPLEYILKSDSDYLQCWLNTYDEAVKIQQDFRCRQSIAAKNFFKPRKTDPSQQSKTSHLGQADPHHNISDSPLDDLVSIN